MSRTLLALLVALACAGGITASGADFTASSSSTGTLTAAADFNTVTVSLGALTTPLAGSVPVSADADSARGIASVKFQSAPHGTSNWVDICPADTSSPYGCSWTTTSLSDGRYDVRAVATDNAGYTRTSMIDDRTLDNYTLSASLADPGANVSGTLNLSATATGAADGLTSLTIQQRAAGGTWTDVCTKTASPASCPFNTTQVADGGRELRAVATDGSGTVAISSLRTPNIDNSPPTNTPSIPATGTGTVSMTADALDTGSGIKSVTFEAQYAGTWYPVCVDTSAPYECSGDSAQVPDGTYPIRVTVENNAGVKTTSTPTSITIDNTPPAPTSLQTSNAGTAGQLESGDTVTFTWSEKIAPGSVLAGWTGSSQGILVRLADNGTNDQMDFYNAAGTTRLNLTGTAADLTLGGDFVSGAVDFNATMTQSGSSITVTLGAPVGTPILPTAIAGTMSWTPSSSAKDMAGNASRTTTVNEPAPLDVDF